MVIVDTSVWATYFNRRESPEKVEVDQLLDEDEVLVVGPILSELIQGTRSEKEKKLIIEGLDALPYVETTKTTWELIGAIGLGLRSTGVTVATADLIIVALAQESACSVYSLDADFKRIPKLRLYTPRFRKD